MTIKEITTGQDSFLDIIANLVGVLVILVVIVGAHAKQSWVKVTDDAEAKSQIQNLETEIRKATQTANELTLDNHRLEATIRSEAELGTALEQQRHQMLVQLQLAQSELEKRRVQLDEKKRILYDRNVKKAALEAELEELRLAARAVKINSKPEVEVIEHYPTPIAKTVFSDEIHFRLANGRITYVPMDELIELMKSEWKVTAERLRRSPTAQDIVGPIAEFRLQYELESVDVNRPAEFGHAIQQVIRLKRFVLVPVHRLMGESMAEAKQTQSEFRHRIDDRLAEKTTVSIWVYPDSFAEFNEIKAWLRERGYQTASWPLSDGKLISGGPDGFRTSAQ